MEFQLLGPIEARHDGARVELGRRRERALLGILLLEAGNPVAIDRLVELLWTGDPPGGARASLHTNVARLRKRLSGYGVGIATRGDSYLVDVGRTNVDVHRFRHLVALARRTLVPAARLRVLQEALAMWNGPVMADSIDDRLRDRIGQDLAELRLVALEGFGEAALAAGQPEVVLTELSAEAKRHPVRERLTLHLMQALASVGRVADALAVYRNTRGYLIENHGLEPGGELMELHQRLLQTDVIAMTDVKEQPAPCLLPARLVDFTGRDSEIDKIMSVLALAESDTAPTVAISGLPGVGKTSLAVAVGHRLRAATPGGQLYADLRGRAEAIDPGRVLSFLLLSLGVRGSDIAEDLSDRAAQYRATAGARRTLIVLDNAGDVSQIRPLLPGRNSLVLITSRHELVDLDGAHHIRLAPPSPDEAFALLSRILGSSRVEREHSAAQELLAHCGHLPLAIRLCAAAVAADPGLTLRDLAGRLASYDERLDHLNRADRSVRAVLEDVYGRLSPAARRLLRTLAVLDVISLPDWIPDIVLDAPAEKPLAQLTTANLVSDVGQDEAGITRYSMHDLVRAFGRERAAAEDPAADTVEALGRAGAVWLTLAEQAHRAHTRAPTHFRRIGVDVPRRQAPIDSHRIDPSRWFQADKDALVALIHQFSAHSALRDHAWTLGWYTEYLIRLGTNDHAELKALLVPATAAAYAAANPEAIAAMELCNAFILRHDHVNEAEERSRLALAAAQEAGHRWLEAETWGVISHIRASQLDPIGEAYALQMAVDGYAEAGDLASAGVKRANLGDLARRRGDPTAGEILAQGVKEMREVADPRSLAFGIRRLAAWHGEQGDIVASRAAYEECLQLVRDANDRVGEAVLLIELGALLAKHSLLDEATERVDAGGAIAVTTKAANCQAYATFAAGRIALRGGDPAQARLLQESALANVVTTQTWLVDLHADLAEVHLALGKTDSARQHLRQGLELAERLEESAAAAALISRLNNLDAI